MAEEKLNLQDFNKQYFRWYYTEGPKKRETYRTMQREAWATYQETGGVPWEEITAEPTPEVTPEEMLLYKPEPTPAVTPTPTVEEQIEEMPEVPTPEPPELPPVPEVTPTPEFEAPEVPEVPGVTPPPTIEVPGVTSPPTIEAPGVTPAPTIPGMEVTPAPEYKPSEEEAAWAEMYGGTIADIIKARGEGIPEETINLMIRQNTQALQAREDENMRLMHNDMERRGITNSGLVFWNEQKIKGATTTALANSITDIQIKSALMKMASFENALGHTGQFLGYLADQSKMIYAGKMATWEAQTQSNLIQYQAQIGVDVDKWKMANQFSLAEWQAQTNLSIQEWSMINQFNLAGWEAQTSLSIEEWQMQNQFSFADWQANTQSLFAQWEANSNIMVENWKMENEFNIAEWGTIADYDMAVFQIETQAKMAEWAAITDIYKMSIDQAYKHDNMDLAAQIAEDYAEKRFEEEKEIAQMEIDNAQAMAKSEAKGSISGSIVTGLFTVAAAIL